MLFQWGFLLPYGEEFCAQSTNSGCLCSCCWFDQTQGAFLATLLCWPPKESNSWEEPWISASLEQLRRTPHTFWGPSSPNSCQWLWQKVPSLQPKENTQGISCKSLVQIHQTLSRNRFFQMREKKYYSYMDGSHKKIWGQRHVYIYTYFLMYILCIHT